MSATHRDPGAADCGGGTSELRHPQDTGERPRAAHGLGFSFMAAQNVPVAKTMLHPAACWFSWGPFSRLWAHAGGQRHAVGLTPGLLALSAHHSQHLDMGRASTSPVGCPEDQETICMDEQFSAQRGHQQMLITNNLHYFWQNPE